MIKYFTIEDLSKTLFTEKVSHSLKLTSLLSNKISQAVAAY